MKNINYFQKKTGAWDPTLQGTVQNIGLSAEGRRIRVATPPPFEIPCVDGTVK